MQNKNTEPSLSGTFAYKICIQLSFMHDRAMATPDFISRILDIKKRIQIGDPIDDADQVLVSDIFDDIMRISQMSEKCKDFGKLMYTNADIDAYLDYNPLK